ncbi:4Fe-4S binding protein [Candidatus Woesearchaeota archaeon]|nr:4Fe-4S binding protein [Candidatus Woesearchaeota archaeon]MBW3014274.1 4Fe-4S binding protein [Candidatus Woesearchaeota archaeon]
MIKDAGNSRNYFTGTWKTTRPVTDYDKCIHCLKCIVYCPENCIKARNDKKAHTEFQYCKGCGLCAQVCPVKCIKIVDEEKFHD